MVEQLRIGEAVYAPNGERLGRLERIVVSGASEGHTQAPLVTHLVVDPGLQDMGELLSPGALEKPRSRTLPISLVKQVEVDAVIVTCDVQEFEQLPLFERHEYVATSPTAGKSRFRWGDVVNYAAATFGLGGAPYLPDTEVVTFNEEPGSASLPAKTPVWRMQPHEEIGHFERALVDSQSQSVTGLVMRRHAMGDPLVIVPAEKITTVEDGVAHVSLTDEELDQLKPYTE